MSSSSESPPATKSTTPVTGSRKGVRAVSGNTYAWIVVSAVLLAAVTWGAMLQSPAHDYAAQDRATFRDFSWWKYPVERNAYLRAELPSNATKFLGDGKSIIRVGDAGLIQISRDGGIMWTTQISLTNAGLKAVTASADGKSIWAVGEYNVIVATLDGGETWIKQRKEGTLGFTDSFETIHVLFAITITTDGKNLWAVGDDGVILNSNDSGATWVRKLSNTTKALHAITSSADSKNLWIAGNDGVILASDNGGTTWNKLISNTNARLQSIAASADGNRLWAAGEHGLIVASRDGGATWDNQISGITTDIQSINASVDGKSAWATSENGMFLAWQDGSVAWSPPNYSRRVAPMYWLLIILLFIAGVFGLRHTLVNSKMKRTIKTIADMAVSDDPISRSGQDRLGFAPIVRAVSEFMRNTATEPPLTFAITAPWGRGKSSMMKLLQADIEAQGGRTVWFNAWHHQQEQVMLAPLLEAVRSQGIPPLWSRPGLRFRLRLLIQRMTKRAVLSISAFALMVAPLIWSWTDFVKDTTKNTDANIKGIRESANFFDYLEGATYSILDRLFSAGWSDAWASVWSGKSSDIAKLVVNGSIDLPFIVLALSFAIGLYLFLAFFWRAFPENPDVLLESTSTKFRIGDVSTQTSFRDRFRLHFAQVAEAIRPLPLVIFIDDLDRCEPAKSAEVLEAVNYLVSNGKCFVVLGMARQIVESQLALVHEKIADQYAKVKSASLGINVPINLASDAQRILYAQNYLRKLIQIEIPVPQIDPDQIRALSAEQTTERAARTWKQRGYACLTEIRRELFKLTPKYLLALFCALSLSAMLFAVAPWQSSHASKQAKLRDEVMSSHNDLKQQLTSVRAWALEARKLVATKNYKTAIEARAKKPCPTPQPGPTTSAECLSADSESKVRLTELDERTEIMHQAITKIDVFLAKSPFDLNAARSEIAVASKASFHAKNSYQQIISLGTLPTKQDINEKTVDSKRVENRVSSEGGGTQAQQIFETAMPPIFWLASMLLVITLLFLLLRRTPGVIKDSDQFRDAISRWSGVFAANNTTRSPREVKRFLNLARYAAARLRGHSQTDSAWTRLMKKWEFILDNQVTPEIQLSEENIVAVAALYSVLPARREFHGMSSAVAIRRTLSNDWPHTDDREEMHAFMTEVYKALEVGDKYESVEKAAPPAEQINNFLRVIGEFTETPSSPWFE